MQRIEALALLQGEGQYADDLNKPAQLVMKVLRSPYAHADIKALDVKDVLQIDGVHCVLTATDADISSRKPMNCRASLDDAGFTEPDRPVLAKSQVKYLSLIHI